MKCCQSQNSDDNFPLEINLEGLICYCFKRSKKELLDAIKSGKEQEIIDDIRAKIKDPGCFYETPNPSGKCCLGDIIPLLKIPKSRSDT